MTNLFDKVKAVCALVVMGLGLAAYSAAPTVISVTAQQRYPWNGLVDIAVTFNGAESDVAKANCTFAATDNATKTALAIAHVTQQGNDTGSGTTWTRRFIWDTNADLGEVKIEDVELFADVEVVEESYGSGGVQLWEGGPYWAECNVGASKPEEYGLYFWWGDTVGHSKDWYFDEDHCPTYRKSIAELQSLGYIDSTGNLAPAYDAARAHLGAPWRMPTNAEFDALRSNCTITQTMRNGVNGRLVTGKGAYAPKSIFLPAAGIVLDSGLDFLSAGYFWSSTPESSPNAMSRYFGSPRYCRYHNHRCYGHSVRPVRGFASSSHAVYLIRLSLDNRTGARVAATAEQIRFSPAWESATAGATAVVSVNGEVVKSATGAGVYEWTPSPLDGTYELTHAVYVNGVQVGETLTATFVAGGIAPRSCDWTTGTMELGWFADAKDLNPITYSVYWSGSADPASCVGKEDHRVGTKVFAPSKIGVQELTIKDDKYLMHGDGLQPIYYHVVGTDGSWSFCKTRNRYALAVGIDRFEGNWANELKKCVSDVALFEELYKPFCCTDGFKKRINSEADKKNVSEDFGYFAKKCTPGDILALYFSTHGSGASSPGQEPDLALYKKGVFGNGEVLTLSDLSSFVGMINSGTAVIGILDTCQSWSIATCSAEDSEKRLTRSALATCGANVAWITSANEVQMSADGRFGQWFLENGWKEGYANRRVYRSGVPNYIGGDDGGPLTFLKLAQYAKTFVDRRFTEADYSGQTVCYSAERGFILDLAAGIAGENQVGSTESLEIAGQTMARATQLENQGDGDKPYVKVLWDMVANASGYRIYRLEAGNNVRGYLVDLPSSFNEYTDPYSYLALDLGYPDPWYDTNYRYVVVPYNKAGFGMASNEADGWYFAYDHDAQKYVEDINGFKLYYTITQDGAFVYNIVGSPAFSAFAYIDLKIPDMVNGIKVKGIGPSAFVDCEKLGSVQIPESVIEISAGAFKNCTALKTVKFNGPVPTGVNESGILDSATAVRYPRKFSAQYAEVVPPEIFAGYTNEKLLIGTEQLPPATEMVDYEVQLECSGGAEPYSWWMSEDGYRIDTETSSFAEVGEAKGWREDGGWWKYELPFAFNCCGHMFKTVFVGDDAILKFEDVSGYSAIETGFWDLYSEGADQDIFVEQFQDRVTFRWKRVKYWERDNIVNCAVTLYSNGVIRCSFGECTDEVRSVEVFGDLIYGAYAEQEGDDDIVFTPNYLPVGLWLNDDGVVSGVPEQAGHYDFEVMVRDDEGEVRSKTLSIEVDANPNRMPTVEGCEPCGDEDVCIRCGEGALFSVEVKDPDGDTLTYQWYLDGEEVVGADGHSYELIAGPDMRGRHWLSCEVSDGLWTVVARGWNVCMGGELFVDAGDGMDALQNALDEAVDGDVIYVGPGTYSPIRDWWSRSLRIIATDGPECTCIDGDHVSPCVQVGWFETTNEMVRLEGFTLENGWSDYGGGASGAWLVGCVVRNNEAEYNGGGLYGGRADSCLIVGNSACVGGGAFSSDLYNCTVVDNWASDFDGGGFCSCGCYNTIVWGNGSSFGGDMSNVEDPMFADADNGDYTLSELSPCVDAGFAADVTTLTDLAGNARIQGRAVDWGAYESPYSLSVPQAPRWLEAYSSAGGIGLEWSEIVNAEFYKIYRVADDLDDDAAVLIGTSYYYEHCEFVDLGAELGVTYRYWVLACNAAGESAGSESVKGTFLGPLEIVDGRLPEGTAGAAYEYVLHAQGGWGAYSWIKPVFMARQESRRSFAEVGERFEEACDGRSAEYTMPFDFAISGEMVREVEIGGMGSVWIRTEADSQFCFSAFPEIDGYGVGLQVADVYVVEAEDAVTFRWDGVLIDREEPFDVAMTFYANGCVRFSSSAETAEAVRFEYWGDDGLRDYSVSEGDVVLCPNALPPGLELDEDGLLSGCVQSEGDYCFAVGVGDDDWNSTTKVLSLRVLGDGLDPIPYIGDSPDSGEIRKALEGSADARLAENITDAATYNAYREWALRIGAAEVKASPFAWVSFATDSAALWAKMLTDDDLTIEEFKPSVTAGAFDFTVSVKGVTIGDRASEDSLKKLFGLAGAELLDFAAFSSENVALDFKEPQDGKLKFTATPTIDDIKSFFMKVKVK